MTKKFSWRRLCSVKSTMFGLRQKLLVGFGGLIIILLLVSGLAIALSMQHRQALSKFLYENWRSVEYGQNMVDDLDRLNDIARLAAAGPEKPQDLSAARATAATALADFDRNLDDENHNLTLPGEPDLAGHLSLLWAGSDGAGHTAGESYRHAFTQLLAPQTTPRQRTAAYAAVTKFAPEVKSAAKAVITLNLNNMTPIEGQVKAMADRTIRLLFILAAAGVALAILFIAAVGRSILQPIRALTSSAREIERGNLDLVVQVNSRDELHELGEAFNSMTARLREYRRTNRAKLMRTQQTTQLAINSLPDAVAILSPEGNVEMANTSAQKLFGLRSDAHVTELRADWLVALFRKTTRDLMPVEPRGYESAIQVLDEGGGERFFLPHAVPILDDDRRDGRQLIGVTVVLADVTHLRRLDEMKSSMLSVVSHELKTPLTSIRMGVHLLLEERIGSLTPQQNDLLTAVREDSDRLNQIVENLLDMGRIESGRSLMDLQSERPERLVSEAIQRIETAYQERGVELAADVPDDLPPVLADRSRMELVFTNLLSNALRFTPPGGHVRVSAAAEAGAVRFTVEDSGPGIPKQYQERIFDRFFRVPGQPKGTGAGLGLAIAKEVVEAHDGQIRVESGEGKGAHFSFTLMRADKDKAADALHNDLQSGDSQDRDSSTEALTAAGS